MTAKNAYVDSRSTQNCIFLHIGGRYKIAFKGSMRLRKYILSLPGEYGTNLNKTKKKNFRGL
jgi:hypothetical protein